MKLRDVVAMALRELGAKENEIEQVSRKADAVLDIAMGDTEVPEADIPGLMAAIRKQHADSVRLADEAGPAAAVADALRMQKEIEERFRRRAQKN